MSENDFHLKNSILKVEYLKKYKIFDKSDKLKNVGRRLVPKLVENKKERKKIKLRKNNS